MSENLRFRLPYLFLDTQACADIFLSINTEQKPVAKSLVFDLYGIASATFVDPASVRARDIATALSTEKASPYYGLIRFPGAPKGQLGVDLSTVVTSVKPLVDDKGVLEAVDIEELEMQTRVLMNYLQALKSWYGSHWSHRDNVFLSASRLYRSNRFCIYLPRWNSRRIRPLQTGLNKILRFGYCRGG